MITATAASRKWAERPSAPGEVFSHLDSMLQQFFERTADAIVLFDPEANVFVDCNAAAVALLRADSKERLLNATPVDVAPPLQADGASSSSRSDEITALVRQNGSHRFEWLARRFDGSEVPLECLATAVPVGDRVLHVVIPRDISERKRAEEQIRQLNATLEQRVADRTAELRASEAQFRTLVEHAPEAIVVFDGATGRFEMVNENAVRLFGLTQEELLRLTPADISPPFQPDGRPSAEAAREKMDEAMSGKTPVFEWQHRHASGRLFASETRLVQLPGERCCLLRASIIDLTERKRAEQTLRESEQKFRALFEATSTGVLIHDERQYLEANSAVVQMLGYKSAADLIGKNPVITSPPVQPGGVPTADLARRHIRECMEHGRARFEWVARHADGTPLPMEVILTRIMMGGRPLIQAVVNDISERKRAEGELRDSANRLAESEARFSAAFHASPMFMTISRMSDGRWVEANEAFLQWSGIPREELVGSDSQRLDLWVHPEARARFWEDLKTTGAVRSRECVIRSRHGTVHTMLLSGDAIEINREPHALLVAVDITERKRAEAELVKALAREQELGQLKSSFVSMVSHEFRTPLGVIQSSAEILRDYHEQLDADERREHLQSIAKNTRRMADMMEEVLVLGSLDGGKMEFQPAPRNLQRLCTRLVDEVLSATLRACPIELRVGEMPDAARIDERLLRHIFSNLLSNAVKYSEPGLPVHFIVEHEGRDAVFALRDCGVGIPQQDQAGLFNAFHRASNVGARAGTGLGLVIVKRCVDLHGGSIRVESKVGEGTTVTVRLPVFSED
jgi:PAS domain S-box-containing protein